MDYDYNLINFLIILSIKSYNMTNHLSIIFFPKDYVFLKELFIVLYNEASNRHLTTYMHDLNIFLIYLVNYQSFVELKLLLRKL
jgi:hypothetical protein